MGIRLDVHGPCDRTGHFGWVFFLGGLAYKLLLSGGSPEDNEERLRMFNAEHEAYKIASVADELRPHIAALHGATTIEAVMDCGMAPPKDCSNAFFLDRCLVIDRIIGESRKFRVAKRENPALGDLAAKFLARQIDIQDSNLFNWMDADAAVVIDFRFVGTGENPTGRLRVGME